MKCGLKFRKKIKFDGKNEVYFLNVIKYKINCLKVEILVDFVPAHLVDGTWRTMAAKCLDSEWRRVRHCHIFRYHIMNSRHRPNAYIELKCNSVTRLG